MERSRVLTPLIDAVDRPANAALALGRRGLLPTTAQAGLGLFAVAIATTATQLLLAGDLDTRVDGLMAFLEVTALLVPIALLAAFLQVRVPLRALLGTVAVGLLQAGLVALTLLPLVAFVALVTASRGMVSTYPGAHAALAGLVVPALALMAMLERCTTIVQSIDGSQWVARSARAMAWMLMAAFLVRACQLV